MGLAWRYADAVGTPQWKGVTWGMLPLHTSGIVACTYHLFYNDPALAWCVALQAATTCLGNATLAFACYRLAVARGWRWADARDDAAALLPGTDAHKRKGSIPYWRNSPSGSCGLKRTPRSPFGFFSSVRSAAPPHADAYLGESGCVSPLRFSSEVVRLALPRIKLT